MHRLGAVTTPATQAPSSGRRSNRRVALRPATYPDVCGVSARAGLPLGGRSSRLSQRAARARCGRPQSAATSTRQTPTIADESERHVVLYECQLEGPREVLDPGDRESGGRHGDRGAGGPSAHAVPLQGAGRGEPGGTAAARSSGERWRSVPGWLLGDRARRRVPVRPRAARRFAGHGRLRIGDGAFGVARACGNSRRHDAP
jgi:hypothetical protein